MKNTCATRTNSSLFVDLEQAFDIVQLKIVAIVGCGVACTCVDGTVRGFKQFCRVNGVECTGSPRACFGPPSIHCGTKCTVMGVWVSHTLGVVVC